MVKEYIQVPLNTSLKGWNAKWFYIRNVEPSLSADIDHLAVPSANWSAKLMQILGLMRNNLDGVSVAINFIIRQI